MYLHIVPNLFHLMANECRLESITIPEFDFKIELMHCQQEDPGLTEMYGLECEKAEKRLTAFY